MKTTSFILDFKLLDEQGLTANEFITLLKCYNQDIGYNSPSTTLDFLQNKGFIKIIEENNKHEIILREKANILIDIVALNESKVIKNKKIINKSSRAINNEIDSFIEEFRELWRGLKPGSMGSISACKEKMYRWMKLNPQYTTEDIMKAARIYIKSLNNYTYLQQADYFIYKKEGKDEQSRLSAFIDEIEQKEDWTSNLT